MSNFLEEFYRISPSQMNYWRSIILFGKNTASYKFSLAQSLLELEPHLHKKELIKLEDLALPYSLNICEHIKNAKRQIKGKKGSFLAACEDFNQDIINKDQLTNIALKHGFNHVIDAFHIVSNNNIDNLFFLDERKSHKGIRLTENFFKLIEQNPIKTLNNETNARWNLVEFAWNYDLNVSLIEYDAENKFLYNQRAQRVNLSSSHDALNGYQKGQCFYCYKNISIDNENENFADVDHLFPYKLKNHFKSYNINGIWNLVLSCKECNRGENGKFDKLINLKYLERLFRRNEYLITSQHPLRETLIKQTGHTKEMRKKFLQKFYDNTKQLLIHEWDTPEKQNGKF